MNKYLIVLVIWCISLVGAFFYGKKASTPSPGQVSQQETSKNKEVITEIIEKPGEKRTIIKEVEVSKVKTNTEIRIEKSNWYISASKSLKENEIILNVNRRIIGNVFMGGYISNNKDIGITVGVEF